METFFLNNKVFAHVCKVYHSLQILPFVLLLLLLLMNFVLGEFYEIWIEEDFAKLLHFGKTQGLRLGVLFNHLFAQHPTEHRIL